MTKEVSVQESVTDMLKVVTTAIDKMREEQSKAIAELQEERKQQAQTTELLKDFVREYDRLTERISTQLRALIAAIEEVKHL